MCCSPRTARPLLSSLYLPKFENVLRHSSADIVLPAISSTGEGDLLSIKGDLVACSTKVDDDAGDCGSCGDAEEEEDEPQDGFLLPLAVSVSPPPQ